MRIVKLFWVALLLFVPFSVTLAQQSGGLDQAGTVASDGDYISIASAHCQTLWGISDAGFRQANSNGTLTVVKMISESQVAVVVNAPLYASGNYISPGTTIVIDVETDDF